MERGLILKKIDDAANKWNETKDPQYKDLWYNLIREWHNGSYNFKRRIISISSCHKNDNGEYLIIGRSRLLPVVRDTKIKTNRLRRHVKPTHHE